MAKSYLLVAFACQECGWFNHIASTLAGATCEKCYEKFDNIEEMRQKWSDFSYIMQHYKSILKERDIERSYDYMNDEDVELAFHLESLRGEYEAQIS